MNFIILYIDDEPFSLIPVETLEKHRDNPYLIGKAVIEAAERRGIIKSKIRAKMDEEVK